MASERLIDANALLEKVQFRLPIDNQNAEIISGCVDITRRIIENAPTVDPVHAAGACYCGECKHWQKAHSSLIGEVMCCTGQGSARIQKAADDFCSSGERRADNGEM